MGVGLSIECVENDNEIDWVWLVLSGIALVGVAGVIANSVMPALPLIQNLDRLDRITRRTKCKFSSLINL